MIKGILIYLALTGAIMVGITTMRHMTGQEIWSMSKTLLFSLVCAFLALFVLVGIVVLF